LEMRLAAFLSHRGVLLPLIDPHSTTAAVRDRFFRFSASNDEVTVRRGVRSFC
jgi:hypothetical protein